MNELEKFAVDGLTVRIIHDDDAQNPRRDYDHASTMVCWHRRYGLGDEEPDCTPDEFFLRLMQDREFVRNRDVPDSISPEHVMRYIDKHYHVLPLYLFDHSGLSMSTGSFSDPWDSGQVGWIYMSKETAEKEGITDPLAYMRSEVGEYDQYLTGDVWGYQIEDENGVTLDSCWGFYGQDYCESEARDAAAACAEQRAHDFTL